MRIHISLNVDSLEKSKNFYARLFGQEASKVREGYANFRLDEPPIHLALQEKKVQPCNGLSHLGLEVPDRDTLFAWRRRLEATGVPFAVEDEAECCYARADKLWLQDPDGYRWEVWVRTGQHDSMGGVKVLEAIKQAESGACC
jgi:catechol 2,3-dioxygenase-like lactoylglutathione lyase family enzyme